MLKKTPLYDEHIRLSARMVEFAGWQMPVSYTSIIDEHLWTRKHVSIFDICHMGEIVVKGDGATEFLDNLLTNNINGLEIGQCRYNLMLNDDGGILDDLIVYRKDQDEYMIVVNAATTETDFDWISSHAPKSLEVKNISDVTAKIDLQGPLSLNVLNQFLGIDFSRLGYFLFRVIDWNGIPMIVSRTGYTGELGYELYVPVRYAVKLWRALLDFEEVRPAGLGARDTLRLEVGYPLYGQDIHINVTPIEANLERFVFWNKDFVGKKAILRKKEEGIRHRLIGVKSHSRRPFRKGDKIHSLEGENIGEITSGSFSPSLGVAIGLGYVDVNFDESNFVIVRGKGEQKATLFSYPFYKEGTVKII